MLRPSISGVYMKCKSKFNRWLPIFILHTCSSAAMIVQLRKSTKEEISLVLKSAMSSPLLLAAMSRILDLRDARSLRKTQFAFAPLLYSLAYLFFVLRAIISVLIIVVSRISNPCTSVLLSAGRYLETEAVKKSPNRC